MEQDARHSSNEADGAALTEHNLKVDDFATPLAYAEYRDELDRILEAELERAQSKPVRFNVDEPCIDLELMRILAPVFAVAGLVIAGIVWQMPNIEKAYHFVAGNVKGTPDYNQRKEDALYDAEVAALRSKFDELVVGQEPSLLKVYNAQRLADSRQAVVFSINVPVATAFETAVKSIHVGMPPVGKDDKLSYILTCQDSLSDDHSAFTNKIPEPFVKKAPDKRYRPYGYRVVPMGKGTCPDILVAALKKATNGHVAKIEP